MLSNCYPPLVVCNSVVLGWQELHKQQAAYRGLLQRNREQPLHLMEASQNAAKPTALPLPFVLIQVSAPVTLTQVTKLPGKGSVLP